MIRERFLVFIIVFLSHFILNAQGSFIKRQVDLNFQGACSVHAADINNDGHQDILGAASGSNQLAWWENDGSVPPEYTKHLIDDNFLVAIYIYSDDINGDSIEDVLGASWTGNQIALWINNGGTPVTWSKQVIDPGFTQAHEVKTANIDGTGGIDIIAASAGNNEIAWWQNNGGSPIAWTKFPISNAVYGARSVFPADIDNDNDFDIVCAAFASNAIILFRNDGGNPVQWTQQVIDDNFSGAHWVYACDIDNDTDQDILGAGYMAGDIAIWYNEGGNPVQWNKFVLEPNLPGALSVVADDLNNDNLIDVAAAGDQSGDVITWYNQGGAQPSFTKYVLEPNFPGAWPVFTCDVDNDTDRDIISASSTLNDIYWWDNQLIPTHVKGLSPPAIEPVIIRAFPNPFINETAICFDLNSDIPVCMQVVSLSGKIVRTMFRGKALPGSHSVTWDGKNDSGNDAEQGSYLCVLRTEEKIIASCPVIKR